jgi:hypothetical protein
MAFGNEHKMANQVPSVGVAFMDWRKNVV